MSVTITHSRIQHGVGQGSFHSASVEAQTGGRSYRFDYVYDCGALKGRARTPELMRAIKRMDVDRRQGMGSKGVIDLLVLSHYDQDHINGAEVLIGRFRVNRIVVPYLSPVELALVLASQAASIGSSMVAALHQLANGSQTLFGVNVTMVRANDAGPLNDGGDGAGGDGGTGGGPDGLVDDARGAAEWPPRPMATSVGPSRRPLGHVIAGSEDVQLAGSSSTHHPFWKLRFWNRGVDDELLVCLFDELVNCDFPLHALDDAKATSDLAQWLSVSKNRKATVEAYRRAVARYAPTWAPEAAGDKLKNFLSLAMYSGPYPVEKGAELDTRVEAWLPAADGYPESGGWAELHYWRGRRCNLVGWLGTGDAPLGELSVWADFSAHYAAELPLTGTVLLPHHGAAPLGGPRFFNPGLHPHPGMLAVISFGKTNTFGHPRAAVLKQVMAARATIGLVTESTAMGLHEVFVLTA